MRSRESRGHEPIIKGWLESVQGDCVGPGAQLDLEKLVYSLQNLVRSVVKTREGRTRITSPDSDEGGGVELPGYCLRVGMVVLRLQWLETVQRLMETPEEI